MFLMNTTQIKAKMVTYFTWGSIGSMFPFRLLVLSSLIYGTGAPRIILYTFGILLGLFRSIYFQSLLIMIKMHKEIYDRTNTINEHNYKLLSNIWPASWGLVVAFFVCNWSEYQTGDQMRVSFANWGFYDVSSNNYIVFWVEVIFGGYLRS